MAEFLNDGRMQVTFSAGAADRAAELADEMGVTVDEVVRQALALLDFKLHLPAGERLVAMRADGAVDAIRLRGEGE